MSLPHTAGHDACDACNMFIVYVCACVRACVRVHVRMHVRVPANIRNCQGRLSLKQGIKIQAY